MNGKRHIVVVAGNYPVSGRQILVFVQELVHSFIDNGVKVTVVAPQSLTHSLLHRQKLLPKYSVRQTEGGISYDIYRPYTISAGRMKIFSKILELYNQFQVGSIVRKLCPDVLYSHFWSSALPIYEYAVTNNIPLFVACGEGDNALEDMVKRFSREKLNQLAKSVTGVISVSSENKRKCVDFGLCLERDIQVFPNCVNTSIFHKKDLEDLKDLKKRLGINDDDFVVGFIGGFIPRKGPDRIAKAITMLDDPTIKVMFIGKPFLGYRYDFDCPGIVYKGPLDHESLPDYLNCMDVFVMPTLKEGCCNAIVEALAVGLPVISSDGAFNDDILDEKNSIRLNPNDVDAIANSIKLLKDNTSLREGMATYSMSRNHEYSIDQRASKILAFIDKRIK